MKPASGFLTSDNVFYKTQQEAEQHEAILKIEAWCNSNRYKWDQVQFIIDKNSEAILDYIHATQDIVSAAVGQETEQASTADSRHEQSLSEGEQNDNPSRSVNQSDAPKISLNKAVYGITEIPTETLQQQSHDRHKPVSNMGRRS